MGIYSEENIAFGPDLLRDAESALRREWLAANGLGGYASGTLATANTRRYHGLLAAALNPPVGRAVLLSKLEETLHVTDAAGGIQDYALSANLYPGATYPQGFQWLQSWSAYPAPLWRWSPAPGVVLEKRIWMAHGQNTTYIVYNLLELPPDCTARLSLVPLLAWRDYHSEMAACDFQPLGDWHTPARNAVSDTAPANALSGTEMGSVLRLALPPIQRVTDTPTTLRLHVVQEDAGWLNAPDNSAASTVGASAASTVGASIANDLTAGVQRTALSNADVTFAARPDWYRHFQYPREQERGLDYQEDLYTPGTLSTPFAIGQTLSIAATTEESVDTPDAAWDALLTRQNALLQKTSPTDAFAQQLTLAADQFIVQVPGGRATIIAGYPWFGDWGRDTMIALPGLCLTTGRFEIAREILLSFSAFVDRGMLPNRFPDVGETPEYNTVDATLWYFVAIYRYVEATGDVDLLKQSLWGILEDIIAWHRRGTRYNIHIDADDGLLYAGQAGVQLTWMDAKVGDWVVTPRIGKPVEINALWHCALRIMAHFAGLLNDASQDAYTEQAQGMQTSFRRRFARPDGQGLYDVLDAPGNLEGEKSRSEEEATSTADADVSIRPNQVFALSLPFAVVDADTPLAQTIIDVVQKELLTPNGLRTLSPQDAAYQPRYEGGQMQRDGAYHQGTVWPWLLGPFASAYANVTNDTEGARAMLAGLEPQLAAFGIGSLAEIYDGSTPQRPNGCYAQAWSVAETLRVWHDLNKA